MKREIFYFTESDCYASGKLLKPSGIVVHSTGTNQRRIAPYVSQMNKSGVRACVHGFIGLDESGELCYTQTLPYDMRCWGCGSGPKGSFNRSHVQIEICEYLSDGAWCRKTYDAMLGLCQELCGQLGISPDNIVCHSEAHEMGYASNHADVMHWWELYGLSMDKFRKELKEQMLENEQNYAVFKKFLNRYEAERRALEPSDYAKESCRKAVSSGIFSDGDGDGSLDAPKGRLLREELAAVLDRLGMMG